MDALPLSGTGLAVDVHMTGVGGGGEDGTELWMGPGDGPNGSFVAAKERLDGAQDIGEVCLVYKGLDISDGTSYLRSVSQIGRASCRERVF